MMKGGGKREGSWREVGGKREREEGGEKRKRGGEEKRDGWIREDGEGRK